MPKPLDSSGGTTMVDEPGGPIVEVLGTVMPGHPPDSEEGGEPRLAGRTFAKEPQLKEPGSVGGVKTGRGWLP